MPRSAHPHGGLERLILSRSFLEKAAGDSALVLHEALTLNGLWRRLQEVADQIIPKKKLSLEIAARPGRGEWKRSQAGYSHDGIFNLVGEPFISREVGQGLFRSTSKSIQYGSVLHVLSWKATELQAVLSFSEESGVKTPSSQARQFAALMQTHFPTAVSRVIAGEEQAFRLEQLTSMLRDFPIGLLILNRDLDPSWYNDEAAFACAIWNHGERRAAALNAKEHFELPSVLAKACVDLRDLCQALPRDEVRSVDHTTKLSHPTLGLHAQIALTRSASNPDRIAFQIQIDYRRPRGDRHSAVSPDALALLARLSTREREVALKIREGQRTAEIAREFHRSPYTIKTQLTSVFTKLGVRSRAQAAALLNR